MEKKKKAFTLIELLAVLVILAIITLIAVPVVLNIINDSRKSSLERSVENYIHAVELSVGNYQTKNIGKNMDGIYVISNKGKVITRDQDTNLSVSFDGIGIESGQIIIENGKIVNLKKAKIDKHYVKLVSDSLVLYEKPTEAIFDTGSNVHFKMTKLSGNTTNVSVYHRDNNIKSIKEANKLKDGLDKNDTNYIVSSSNSENKIYMWYENNTIWFYTDADVAVLNKKSSGMFEYLNILEDISGLSSIDASNVINMIAMFDGCTKLSDIKALSNWNVEKVKYMNFIFSYTDLENLNGLENWTTSSLNSITSMFHGCTKLSDIKALSNWNVENVESTDHMFYGCTSLSKLDGLENWDTKKLTYMNNMFHDCSSLSDIKALSNWDVENVTNMDGTFAECTNLTDLKDLKNWDTKNVTNMNSTFAECTNLTDLKDLKNWDTKNVTDMQWMFARCSNLSNVSDINDWDINKVSKTKFTYMFSGVETHPEFTKRAGTWENGTFTPSN